MRLKLLYMSTGEVHMEAYTEKTSWLFQPQSGCPGCNQEWVMRGFFWHQRLIAQGNQRGSCSDHLTTTILLVVSTTM